MHAAGPHERGSRLDGHGLDELAAMARSCRLCRLADGRTGACVGAGDPEARVMFVVDAPGYHEDRSGELLQGESGNLLTQLLVDAGLDRDDVYVTAAVKCRPPRNRSPFPDEVEACEGYLFREIMLIRPLVVCAMGNLAARLVTGRPLRVSEIHGQPQEVQLGGRPVVVMPLYHPAAAGRVSALGDELRADLRSLRALVDRLANGEPLHPQVEAPPAAVEDSPPDPHAPPSDQTQLSLLG